MQLRTEELTYNISEINSQNSDLRKQLQKADHYKSYNNRTKIEVTLIYVDHYRSLS